MDKVLTFLSDIRVVIGIGVIVLIIILWFIVKKIQSGKYKKELQELEVRYNSIKSVPLSFKMTKAVAIARVDPEAMSKVTGYKDDFDKAQANLKQISSALADTEDNILIGKLKDAKKQMLDLDSSLLLGEQQVGKLNQFLDSILEKENAQRTEVTQLKNEFRDLKASAQEKSNTLSYCWNTIEKNITETEKMFSAFEEWMYASDFEKANAELVSIKTSMERLKEIINTLPELLSDARGVIPNMVESLHHDYTSCKSAGVYLKHLNVEKNLSVITASLKDDLSHLKEGDATDVRTHLDDYKTRITQLDEQIRTEAAAVKELKPLTKETEQLSKDSVINLDYVSSQYQKASVRFGLEDMEQRIGNDDKRLKELAITKSNVFSMAGNADIPASTVLSDMKELNQDLTNCNNDLNDMKQRLESAAGDEERAKRQLVKLQIIMNEMQVKRRKYKLPSISSNYEEDMNKANEYIRSLGLLIDENPLNVQLLNATLQEAISFIYKLYNDLTNMIASVIMVENTIVFGNRYRSTYADIDSDLTRSELCFRNGEYTQALTIAIATIEKIHPGNYETMIKENSKSAA